VRQGSGGFIWEVRVQDSRRSRGTSEAAAAENDEEGNLGVFLIHVVTRLLPVSSVLD
jgi:hypothetical protein